MKIEHCIGDKFLKTALCLQQPRILLGLMFFTDLILFFLDTYLWYIIFNTVFSVARSFYHGRVHLDAMAKYLLPACL